MYCRKCGQELSDEGVFCPRCGNVVSEDAKGEARRTEKDTNDKTKRSGEKIHKKGNAGKKALMVVMSMAVLLTGIVAYQFVFKDMFGVQYLAQVQNEEGKYGYINEKGEEVIPCQYDWGTTTWIGDVVGIGINDGKNSSGNLKYGAINKKGEVVIPLKYDGIYLSNGVMWLAEKVGVNENGDQIYNWGCMDTRGKEILDFEYQFISEDCFSFDDYENENGWFVVSQSVDQGDEEGNIIYNYGIVNNKGEVVVPIGEQYIESESFGNNDFIAASRETTEGTKFGYINSDNEVAIPFEYDGAYNFGDDGLARVVKDGMYGYINEKGHIVVGFEYVEAYDFSNGLAAVREKEGGSFEYINTEGDIVISAELSDNWDVKYKFDVNKKAIVHKESEGYGLINEKGKEILPCIYDNMGTLATDYTRLSYTLYWVGIGDSEEYYYMIANSQGELLNEKFDDLGGLGENGWCSVAENIGENSDGSKKQKWRYIDANGETVLNLSEDYTWAGPFFPVS